MKTGVSSAPIKANDITPIKHRDITTAIPTMNVGPSGMTPPEPRSFGVILMLDGSFSFFRLGFSRPIRLVDFSAWAAGAGFAALALEGAKLTFEAFDELRSSPVVERKDRRLDMGERVNG